MKLGQNICLDEISDEYENLSCQVKTRSLGQIFEKLCVCSRDQIFGLIVMKLGVRVFASMKSCTFLENGSCRVKN